MSKRQPSFTEGVKFMTNELEKDLMNLEKALEERENHLKQYKEDTENKLKELENELKDLRKSVNDLRAKFRKADRERENTQRSSSKKILSLEHTVAKQSAQNEAYVKFHSMESLPASCKFWDFLSSKDQRQDVHNLKIEEKTAFRSSASENFQLSENPTSYDEQADSFWDFMKFTVTSPLSIVADASLPASDESPLCPTSSKFTICNKINENHNQNNLAWRDNSTNGLPCIASGLKMEKAMQQRMKIEKEKEERLRCRTNSKQEVLLQKEGVSKKIKKIELQEEKINSPKKTPESPKTKTYSYTNVASSLKANVEEAKSSKKAPPKPVRTPAKKAKLTQTDSEKNNLTSLEKVASASNKAVHNSASVKTAINELKPVNQAVTKSALNTTYVNTPKDEILTSTPAAEKLNTIDTKTPLLKNKPISYAITPDQSSFVSYDISEIKSDDSDDDEEENTNQKPIPSWASSIRLRNVVLNQYYNPLDTDELFGNYFETSDLAIIMGVKKKQ